MKNHQQALNEFLAGIHSMIKNFSYDDLVKLHEVIYIEISKRKEISEAWEKQHAKD
jgi:hypothetical protein